MIKTAIFVEGQTELVFVREYLLKMFGYRNIDVQCYKLIARGNLTDTPYPFTDENAEYYFEIINAGSDNSVLSKLLEREEYIWKRGFHKIFGIRDMYSENYKEYARGHTINSEINISFIKGAEKTIAERAIRPGNIYFHYAIMETEAWILGMKDCLLRLYPSLTPALISQDLNMNIENDDPETTYFHPAKNLNNIYRLAGSEYRKKESDINAVMAHIQKEDFIELSQSQKCKSFGNLHHALFNSDAFQV